MAKHQKQNSLYLKNYYIILLIFILCLLPIINSKYVNNQKNLLKLNNEGNELFDRIIRKLEENQEENTFSKNSDKICKANSYNTGDFENLDNLNNFITYENEDKKYFKSFLNIINYFVNIKNEKIDKNYF